MTVKKSLYWAMDFEQIPVCERIDLGWQSDSEDEDDPSFDPDDWHRIAPVKFFTHELSIRGRLRRLLIRNSTSRLASTFFDLIIRCVICLIYIVRVHLDNTSLYTCNGRPAPCNQNNNTEEEQGEMLFSSTNINWYVLLWVHRPLWLWIMQVSLSAVTIFKALILVYVTTKGHRMEQILTTNFFLEVVCSTPYLLTLAYPPLMQHLFVPGFLNCWLAKLALERIFNDLHLTRTRFQTISVTLSQQILLLVASLFCMVFTTICGIQHIQRGSSETPLTMFESLYFVIVTFSTVGYGDISPDIWLGQLFMILMICIALAFIPRQIEVIASTWIERQKAGGEYSHRAASRNKHVVVCSSVLNVEAIMDFLNEFYAHPKLEKVPGHKHRQEHMVILLSPRELDNSMQVILKDPKWTHRVIYMRGSPLKDLDLKRCRIHQADACFFLAPRSAVNKAKADQHTILRSWAVKDFAPNCKQYIQLFKAKNKMHVKFAEHLVCEDEFKYALLANNCLYPGLSTLVSLLVHTSSGIEGDIASETWQQVYGRHAGNEIYHIQVQKSIFFSQYSGSKFTEASADAHQRFGVALLAVLDPTEKEPKLLLNPGPKHILKKTDYCFYMSVTKEEYSRINPEALKQEVPKSERVAKNLEQIALALQKYQKEEEEEDDGESVFDTITSLMGQEITKLIQKKNENKNNNESSDSFIHSEKGPDVINMNETPQDTLDGVSHRTGTGKVLQFYSDMGQERFTIGVPPITMYVGSRRTLCHIVEESRPFCCLKWGTACEHCSYKTANDDRWHNQLIILAAEQASSGIYHFIVPLRSNFISMNGLSPIILLVEEEPSKIFLETISKFPLVYWMKGRITSVDDLLQAGINKASHLVVVNRTPNQKEGEETLCDAQTIVAVQTIFRLFPNANIITELNQANNMRFMQFRAHDIYSQRVSRLEQKLKQTMGSNMSHIFRLPFAAGQVFSASMLDTLLYQTFVKGYLITFVRLLLGIDAEENSGHLSSIRVRHTTVARFPTYGELYQGLCTATGEIPIAIYRTERQKTRDDMSDTSSNSCTRKLSHSSHKNPFVGFQHSDHLNLADVIRNRLKSLDLCQDDYCERSIRSTPMISYTIANPSPKRRLKVGDIVYVIQPSSMVAIPNIQKWRPRAHSYSGPMRPSDKMGDGRRGSLCTPAAEPQSANAVRDKPVITPILKSSLVTPVTDPTKLYRPTVRPSSPRLPTRFEPLNHGDDIPSPKPKNPNTNPIITVTTTGNRKYEVQKVADEDV
ncbi:potassium channel subfamily T member 2-like isoform X2 [Haliotis asinina]|uniref:potassium channel subfamily T member 2-like isoform X2 n=1 Tax=Haliotis asinina TaxID=109174 RepID=UPI003531A80A